MEQESCFNLGSVMSRFIRLSLLFLILCISADILATNYFVHPEFGDDKNKGIHLLAPLRSLARASKLDLQAGDSVFLAAGHTFKGMLKIQGKHGEWNNPIRISSYQWGNRYEDARAIIDASKALHGIYLIDCSHIIIENLIIQADDADGTSTGKMKCGVLVTTSRPGLNEGISINNLLIKNIYIEAPGFSRGKREVLTANGTQRYGWGIRFINQTKGAVLNNLIVKNCVIKNVAHTGIKFTSKGPKMDHIEIYNNRVLGTGGPGIQMSGVINGHIKNNYVNKSGANNDPRKWGRGSGLWTWNSSNIIIENNYFLNANGPGDSAGCHIDYNCNDIVVQYNFSANNAGGFCEILGNSYNCAYRYNISVNDGHRVKGVQGAFQEGKTLWLSGYQGKKGPRKGPFNSYFYNNTIYVSKDIVSKIAISKTAEGVLIANNIFHVDGKANKVPGDQNMQDIEGESRVENVFFQNNLYLNTDYWPKEIGIQDESKIVGDPNFIKKYGDRIEDYLPRNVDLIKNNGIEIPCLKQDSIGLKIGLAVLHDILGNPIIGKPDLGAIELD